MRVVRLAFHNFAENEDGLVRLHSFVDIASGVSGTIT